MLASSETLSVSLGCPHAQFSLTVQHRSLKRSFYVASCIERLPVYMMLSVVLVFKVKLTICITC